MWMLNLKFKFWIVTNELCNIFRPFKITNGWTWNTNLLRGIQPKVHDVGGNCYWDSFGFFRENMRWTTHLLLRFILGFSWNYVVNSSLIHSWIVVLSKSKFRENMWWTDSLAHSCGMEQIKTCTSSLIQNFSDLGISWNYCGEQFIDSFL